ncbi:sugar phosphate isomerase/epimerase family protein [Flavihumibacter profundi]|uniref:sugar phosphate isomerase/epimerase family protein n=1 Tax=Flavihumibacter profundi TaxID=2716883 RepID=UPI001CC4FC8F|nr:sugar phosphate isomerase/epimerase [Flavihumibacter profundi]MBZ5857422.1 sugar phosphate isomerase/epimerase [Flavihumibacter profundi]
MNNRRNFIRNSGLLALGGLVLSRKGYAAFLEEKKMHPLGLQLYTLGRVIDNDVRGTLQKVAEIGYKDLESAFSMKGGYYGMKPKEFAALTKELGLSWVSHHTIGAPFKMPPGGFKPPAGADTTKQQPPMKFPPMMNLKENHQQIVDEAAEGGVKFLVCSSIPLNTLDEIKEAIEILNRSGEAAKKAGLTFCYHNHTHEFESVEGQVPYDMLLSQVSADLLKMELDLGWATKAGADPVALFKKYPGRFPLWHVKDITAEKQAPTEVGNGTVDFKRIFAASKDAGMKHFFVEQDGAPNPLENIATSYKNITTKILA